jgi:hypothetical protein
MDEGRGLRTKQPSGCAVSGGVGVAGTSGRATTHKAGRAEPMSGNKAHAQPAAQAGATGEAAGVGSAVGGVRSSDDLNWLDLWGAEPGDAKLAGIGAKGRCLSARVVAEGRSGRWPARDNNPGKAPAPPRHALSQGQGRTGLPVLEPLRRTDPPRPAGARAPAGRARGRDDVEAD